MQLKIPWAFVIESCIHKRFEADFFFAHLFRVLHHVAVQDEHRVTWGSNIWATLLCYKSLHWSLNKDLSCRLKRLSGVTLKLPMKSLYQSRRMTKKLGWTSECTYVWELVSVYFNRFHEEYWHSIEFSLLHKKKYFFSGAKCFTVSGRAFRK